MQAAEHSPSRPVIETFLGNMAGAEPPAALASTPGPRTAPQAAPASGNDAQVWLVFTFLSLIQWSLLLMQQCVQQQSELGEPILKLSVSHLTGIFVH